MLYLLSVRPPARLSHSGGGHSGGLPSFPLLYSHHVTLQYNKLSKSYYKKTYCSSYPVSNSFYEYKYSALKVFY